MAEPTDEPLALGFTIETVTPAMPLVGVGGPEVTRPLIVAPRFNARSTPVVVLPAVTAIGVPFVTLQEPQTMLGLPLTTLI